MLRPTGKNILIKVKEKEKKGVLIVTSKEKAPFQASVIAIGSKAEADFKVGDTLLINTYGGIKANDEEGYMIITEEDVLGVVE